MVYQPVPTSDDLWRHDVVVNGIAPDGVAPIPDSRLDESTLVIQYDPANGDAWLASNEPLHLRGRASMTDCKAIPVDAALFKRS